MAPRINLSLVPAILETARCADRAREKNERSLLRMLRSQLANLDKRATFSEWNAAKDVLAHDRTNGAFWELSFVLLK